MTCHHDLVDALTLALHALNQAPSFRLRHDRYRTSYQVCAVLDAVLSRCAGAGDAQVRLATALENLVERNRREAAEAGLAGAAPTLARS